MRYRRLPDGRTVVANGNEIPVILPSLAKEWDLDKIHSFAEHEFLDCSVDIEPPSGVLWFVAGWLIRVVGMLSIASMLVMIIQLRIFPSGRMWMADFSFGQSLLFVVTVAVSTAIVHEGMHMVFGRQLVVQSHVLTGTLRTRLNHIWGWPKAQAIDALLAGLAFDVLVGAVSLTLYQMTENSLYLAIWSILMCRIVWQGNLFAKRDVSLAFCQLLSKPEGLFNNVPNRWRIFLLVAFDVIIIGYWLITYALGATDLLLRK